MKRLTWTLALVCFAGALGTTAVAPGSFQLLKISLHPNTGKFGTKFAVEVHETVRQKYTQLELTITNTPGARCATSYTKGFSTQSGLAGGNGKPMAQRYEKVGKTSKSVLAKITISQPGTYGICAYLNVGSSTKAHASAPFTITQ